MAFDRPGFDKEVGLLLQLARKRRGITQADVAKKIGIPRATYANLESGRQRIPTDILWRAAVVLSVSISTLVPEPLSRHPQRESLLPFSDFIFGQPALASDAFSTGVSPSMQCDASVKFPVAGGICSMPWLKDTTDP